MEFQEQKKQIIAQLQRGDKRAIAKIAKLSSVTVWNALNKNSVSEMTEAEKKAWVTTVNVIDKRKNGEEKIMEQTSKVAERI